MIKDDFIAANKTVDAIVGATRHGKEGGAVLILTDYRSFDLSAVDILSLPAGYPKWVNGTENYI